MIDHISGRDNPENEAIVTLLVAISVTYDIQPSHLQTLTQARHATERHGDFILIDNGPPDGRHLIGSIHDALQFAGKFRICSYVKNRGFGGGCNTGVSRATISQYILLVNPDASINSKMVDALLDVLGANPRLAIVSPQLVDRLNRKVEAGGNFPTIASLFTGKLRLRTTIHPINESADSIQHDHIFEPIDWVSGAVMMIRREAWDAVGGFDPNFFLYYEDIDLCRRIRAAGWEVGVVPTATAIHESGGSQWRPGTRSRVERIYFQSQAYYFRKHHGRVAEFILRAVRLPYLATGLRRWYLRRFGVQVHVDHSAT